MIDNQINIIDAAKTISRNPLGIIALFIVLVYGFVSLVITLANNFTAVGRLPLIYSLVLFSFIVLIVFAWLVSKRGHSLYRPDDFKNEDNYIKMQLSAAVPLIAAEQNNNKSGKPVDITFILNIVRKIISKKTSRSKEWNKNIHWVYDYPENNIYEQQAFETLGLSFTLAESSTAALALLQNKKLALIISDMGRNEGARGDILLDAIHLLGDKTPLILYASSNAPAHKRETIAHGGQGCTNNPQVLSKMVTECIIKNA